jgi:hypothetical protein
MALDKELKSIESDVLSKKKKAESMYERVNATFRALELNK